MKNLTAHSRWDLGPGTPLASRGWFVSLLVMAALFAAVRIGKQFASGALAGPIFLSFGIAIAVALLRQPHLALWLIPIALGIPRSAPRLFGVIGVLEALLPIVAFVWMIHVTVHPQRVRMDRQFRLLLLAALPMVLSWLTGRGDSDFTQLYTWLAGSATYLLALNLATSRRLAERALLWTAIVMVALLFLDYQTTATIPSIEDLYISAYVYRQSLATVGAATFVAALLAVMMPILLSYAFLARRKGLQIVCACGAALGLLLGFYNLSRIFFVGTAAGLLPQLYVLWRRKGIRYVVLAVACITIGLVAIVYLVPAFADLMLNEFITSPQRIGNRMALSVTQLQEAFRSLLWGYGSNRATSRAAHSMIPTAMYDYGLFFTLPLLGFLSLWLIRAVRLVREVLYRSQRENPLAFAHLGIVVAVLVSMIYSDFLITTATYTCLSLFIAGLLGAAVADRGQEATGSV